MMEWIQNLPLMGWYQYYQLLITIIFTLVTILIGWFLVWHLFLKRVPLIQELCNLETRPTNSQRFKKKKI